MVPVEGTSLHHCALAATAVLVFIHLEVLHVVVSRAVASGVRRHVPVVSPDFADNVEESVVDVDTSPSGCFDEFAAESACERSALCLMLAHGLLCHFRCLLAQQQTRGVHVVARFKGVGDEPSVLTCLSASKSHLFPTTMMGK
jgi:hypothetical protein